MSKQKALSIVAFVGLPGSGKSTASEYVASLGTPRITSVDTREIIAEIGHIADAGQRLILLDDLASWEQCLAIKHAFPGRLSIVALVTKAPIRFHRLNNRTIDALSAREAEELDRTILRASAKAEPIAAADYTIINEDSLEALTAKIDTVIEEIRTCKSNTYC